MKKGTLLSVVIFFMAACTYGQGELDTQKKIFYRNEKSGAILLNSNGYGLSYRYGKWLNDRNKKLYEIEFNHIIHAKEVKFPYYSYYNTSSFVYGKLNTLFTLRGGPGFQHEIFQKADRGGISIRSIFAGGLSIALYKPVYYDVIVMGTVPGQVIGKESKKFTVDMQPSEIIGRSSFFKGLDETKVLPGIYGKAGYSFEYSPLDQAIHALELGVSLELFPRKIPIMYTEKNSFYYFAFFISYRFGKIINTQASTVSDISNSAEK